jgi:hypothetical protein
VAAASSAGAGEPSTVVPVTESHGANLRANWTPSSVTTSPAATTLAATADHRNGDATAGGGRTACSTVSVIARSEASVAAHSTAARAAADPS